MSINSENFKFGQVHSETIKNKEKKKNKQQQIIQSVWQTGRVGQIKEKRKQLNYKYPT